MQAGSVVFRADSTDGDRPTPNEPAIAITRKLSSVDRDGTIAFWRNQQSEAAEKR